MAPDAALSQGRSDAAPVPPEVGTLFHRLNNQLGVILANAELLEHRLADEGHRVRAAQVVSGAVEAIATVQRLRQAVWRDADSSHP